MPYQTRPKSCLPPPRSCVMRQPLNMQLACNCKSVRGSHRLSIAHGQEHSHPSDRACPNEPLGSRSHWNWPHTVPSFHKAQKAPPDFQPLSQRGEDNVCVWTGKSWPHTLGEQAKPPCCGMHSSGHPSAPEPSWAWENRSGCNTGSRNWLSTLPTRLKLLQTPATHPSRTPLMLPLGANLGEEAYGRDAGQGPAAEAPRLVGVPACRCFSSPLPISLPGSSYSNSTSTGLGFYSSAAAYKKASGDVSFSKAEEETSSVNR